MRQFLRKNFVNVRGPRTNRRLVVIESDDWGSIRTPNMRVLSELKDIGVTVDQCHYMLFDSLASNEDITLLFNLLSCLKDDYGRHPVITANCLMANPNFDKIKDSNFEEYFYEDLLSTFNKYPAHDRALSLWMNGFQTGVFFPQCHGREHLNIGRWLTDLRNGRKDTRIAFDNEMFGISGNVSKPKRGSYMAALDGGSGINRGIIAGEGLELFKEFFGFPSISFIAPNYIWDEDIEKVLSEKAVRIIQGSHTQVVSSNEGEDRNYRRHYFGQRNGLGQFYTIRNCLFEPSSNPTGDWVDTCLRDIKLAFKYRKPAVICSHRVNYIGYLNEKNRDDNLVLLESLLRRILKEWPDVEFLNTTELMDILNSDP